jgi:hypothetical protein
MSEQLALGRLAEPLAWLEQRATERGYKPARLAGVSVGGCADAHGTSRVGAMRRSAHAHTDPRDPLQGWLCFKAYGAEHLRTGLGLPSSLLRHEYAHLLAPRAGHGLAWRRAVAALGAPAEARAAENRAAGRAERRPATWYWPDPEQPGTMRSGTYREMKEATQ